MKSLSYGMGWALGAWLPSPMLAQGTSGRSVGTGWDLGGTIIAIVIIAAVVAVLYVALRQFGIAVPQWLIHILWIVAVAVVAILAIRFLLSL